MSVFARANELKMLGIWCDVAVLLYGKFIFGSYDFNKIPYRNGFDLDLPT